MHGQEVIGGLAVDTLVEEGTGEEATAVDIMEAGALGIMAEAMVMEATTGIPIMASISAHRFILTLITASLISTPTTTRQL